MTRRRQVGGTTTFKTDGDHKRFSFIDISQSSEDTVIHNGTEHGLSFNASEEYQKQDKDFGIAFSLDRRENTVVPLGIFDFKNKSENACFRFNYTLSGDTLNSLEFQIKDSDGTIIYQMTHLEAVVVTAAKKPMLLADIENKSREEAQRGFKTFDWQNILKKYEPKSEDLTQPGSYTIFWDGFDNEGIYDSSRFDDKKFTAKITATKNGVSKSLEVSFKTERNKANWVDVKIDRNNFTIDTTLRLNLTDGGTKGFETESYRDPGDDPRFPPLRKRPIWKKIPSKVLQPHQPVITQRSKTFAQLVQFVIDAMGKYWSRNANRNKNVKIGTDNYQFNLNAQNTSTRAMNSLPLVYNTNRGWMRSGNPGGSYDDDAHMDNLFDALPDKGVIQRLSYNTGYIQHDWDEDTLGLDGWRYHTDTDNNGYYDAISEFKETAAHEIGHEILQAYGGTVYSWQHKGSSYYFPQDTKPIAGDESFLDRAHLDYMNTSGEYYPKSGEIDLMKYYHAKDKNKTFISGPDLNRTIAAERDVLGLVWLTKIKIL